MNPRLPDAIEVPVLVGGTDAAVKVVLPNDPVTWPAGIYSIAAVISKAGEPDRMTNELPLMLAPQITNISIVPLSPPVAGGYTATVICSPQVLPNQSAALLLGDRQLPTPNHPAKTDTLTFSITSIPDGEYYVRLRIDGVDSLLIDRSVSPPIFDVTQKVTLP